jgi:signal transduction histidine kinase
VVVEDNAHSFWLYMACGLVRIARSELDSWAASVDAATVDKAPNRSVQVTAFDSSDGVRSHAGSYGFGPRVAKTKDGKLWFLPLDGVSVIDPQHLPFNRLLPPVHIEQITADRKTYEASSNLRLPPLVRDVWIDYTALSFVAPEKIRFRYKLEGQDRDWKEVVNDREAQYSNLAPGNYRFRVTACNNSGVWNEAGAFLDFSVAPAYYQTTWFRGLCAAAFALLLWLLYQLRLKQLARQFNMGLEAQVRERTRIARELHDTLLQSFHGLLIRFQSASNLLPERPAEAKQRFESAIDQAAQAITEGRDAVQGLRSSMVETNNLARAISALGEELVADESSDNSPIFHVHVEGAPRNLDPLLRDEVYRIAAEALRNAFRHACAKRVEVEIRFDERQLRLRVRDDGKGIDPNVLKEGGRAGHWGLSGMRERAKLIGGNLELWSELDSGMEVELSIPASSAYRTSAGPRRSWLAEKLSGKGTDMKS